MELQKSDEEAQKIKIESLNRYEELQKQANDKSVKPWSYVSGDKV